MLRAFRHERGGNVVITFALTIVPIVGFIGTAVDYSRANSAKAAMQSAVDSIALMLSKDAQSLTSSQLNQKAGEYFNALFTRPDVNSIVVTPTFSSPSPGDFKLTVSATGKVPTSFSKIFGQENLNLSTTSQVLWGVKKLELALALDVTGSMASNNKMTELKKAAKNLLATLQKTAATNGDVKVAIVPFAYDVNVGTSSVNANWINWSDWEAPPPNSMPSSSVGPGSSCPYTTSSNGFRCTTSPTSETITSTIPSSGSYSGYICPSAKDNASFNGCYNSVQKPSQTVATGWSASCGSLSNCSCSGSGSSKVCTQSFPGQYNHTWIKNARSTWNGCVTDRDQDYDVSATAPSTSITSTLFVTEQATACPATLTPLSFNWNALNDKIDDLSPTGNTNVTIGLAWAFHALTPSSPLSNASAAAPDLDKVVILLTDGDNTQNRWTTSTSQIDARTKKACDNVKAANIKLYTIRVIDGNASLLQSCASKPDMYYDVQNASQLNAVFSAIAQNLANLRIAK